MYQRTFLIIFKPAEKKQWWNLFLHKDFGHCYIATYLAKDRTLIIDPSEGGIGIYERDIPIEYLAGEVKLKGYAAFVSTARQEDMEKPTSKLFLNCVTLCKAFVGIRNIFIITPYQLYRYLEKTKVNNEQPIYQEKSEH